MAEKMNKGKEKQKRKVHLQEFQGQTIHCEIGISHRDDFLEFFQTSTENRRPPNSQRQIILCHKENIEECHLATYRTLWNGSQGPISGWTLNYTTSIKLSETKMWLRRL